MGGTSTVEAEGWSQPGVPAGGDCFDHWSLPDGQVVLFLGGVVRPGGPKGAVTRVRAMLRALSLASSEPDWLLARVNAKLAAPTDGGAATAFLACIAPDGMLRWCSAGHGPVFVRRSGRGRFDILEAASVPLGTDPALRPAPAVPLHLEPGGRLAVVGAGLLHALNDGGQPFGAQRVKTVLDNTDGLPLDRAVALLRDVVLTWQGHPRPFDDLTVLLAGLSE